MYGTVRTAVWEPGEATNPATRCEVLVVAKTVGQIGHGLDAGVSLNDLTDELAIDPLSGTAALNGIPVTVAKG